MDKYERMKESPEILEAPPSYTESVNPKQPASVPLENLDSSTTSEPAAEPSKPRTIIIQNVLQPLGPQPCMVICPSCRQRQMSKIRYETTTRTHYFATLLCVFGLVCLTCLPYYMKSCRNPNHYCTNCDAYLGTYRM